MRDGEDSATAVRCSATTKSTVQLLSASHVHCMLTRPDFDGACKAFIAKYSSSERVRSPATDGLDGWAWDEHTVRKPRSLVLASGF